jgi:hypothetical protein
MDAATYDVAGFAEDATETAPRKGIFVRILHSLQKSQMDRARRMIVKYARLLPEGQKPADVMPFLD